MIQTAPVDADPHSLAIAGGDFDHLGEIIVTPFAATHIARVDAVLRQRLGTVGKLCQQFVPVVVEIAAQRHRDAHAIEMLPDRRHLARGLRRIDGDAHALGSRLSKLLDLDRRRDGVRGIGIGHGLHQYRRIAAHQHLVRAPPDRDLPGDMAKRGPHRKVRRAGDCLLNCAHRSADLSHSGTRVGGTSPCHTATAHATTTTARINTSHPAEPGRRSTSWVVDSARIEVWLAIPPCIGPMYCCRVDSSAA